MSVVFRRMRGHSSLEPTEENPGANQEASHPCPPRRMPVAHHHGHDGDLSAVSRVHGGDLRDVTRLPRGNSTLSRHPSGQPLIPPNRTTCRARPLLMSLTSQRPRGVALGVPHHHRFHWRASCRRSTPDHVRIRSSAVISIAPDSSAVVVMKRSAGSGWKSRRVAAAIPTSPVSGHSRTPWSRSLSRQASTGYTSRIRSRWCNIAVSQNEISETPRSSWAKASSAK
jgi:hypothetical protein